MAEAQGTTESATQDKKGGAPVEGQNPWYTKPESLGNTAGEKIESTLSPVGKHVGTGLNYVAAPVGGLVDGVAGGIMRSGEAFGEAVGVGFGNKDGGPSKAREKEGERLKEDFGGKEQTGDNPLGL